MKRILYLQSASDLTKLAEACLKLSPKLSLPTPHDLYLDIAGTEKCMGGEGKILFLLEELLSAFQIRARKVLTDYEPWAKPLAFGEDNLVLKGKTKNLLLVLPIERLIYCGDPAKLEEEMPEREKLVAFLQKVGFKTIGDFAALSDVSLVRRFGKFGLTLKQWVDAEKECHLRTFHPDETITESIDTDSIIELEALLFYLRQSLTRLEARLQGRMLAARELKLKFHLEGAEEKEARLSLIDPTRDSKAFLLLLKEYLGKMEWTAPLERLEVSVSQSIPFISGQLSLFDKTENLFTDLSQYVSRLRYRYGEENVGFTQIRESHIPERAVQLVFPPKPTPPALPHFPKRPLFLYTPPKPYALPQRFKLTPSENVATEWWDETANGARRYFINDTSKGERLWVFFDIKKQQWFLHGTFD